MEKIGETLRNARLAKNITIDEIVKETNIRSRYIEALEAEEWEVFPGAVYLKGFLKSYCAALGLDDKPLLAAVSQQIKQSPETPPVPQKIELPGRPRRKLGFIFGIIAIILLVAFQYVYQNFINKPIPAVKEQPPAVQTPAAPPAQAPTEPSNNTPAGPNNTSTPAPPAEPVQLTAITLRLVGVEGKCWVRIRDGQMLVYEGTMSKGEEKIFTGLTAIDMVLGNSGGVQYFLNDQDYGIAGKVGQRINKTFVIENNVITEKINP